MQIEDQILSLFQMLLFAHYGLLGVHFDFSLLTVILIFGAPYDQHGGSLTSS